MLQFYNSTSKLPITWFQFIFGLYFSIYNFKHLYLNWLPDLYTKPNFHSTYPFFPFHLSLPLFLHILLYTVLISCGLGIAFNYREKFCTIVALSISIFYFVSDRLYYSDFAYLSLLFLFCILIINWATHSGNSVPIWKLLLIRALFWTVSFISLIQLMGNDFLETYVWVSRVEIFKFHSFLSQLSNVSFAKFGVYFIIILYSICLIFLLTKKLKKTGLFLWFILQISLYILFYKFELQVSRSNFPILMIIGSISFIEEEWALSFKTKILNCLKRTTTPNKKEIKLEKSQQGFKTKKLTTIGLICLLLFMSIQILLPLRGYIVGHREREWTNAQNIFSWRMKLKQFYFYGHLSVKNPATGLVENISIYDYHLPSGSFRMGSPYSILKFSQFLEKKYNEAGYPNVEIYGFILARLNNDTVYKPLINSTIDLTKVKYNYFSKNDWILPYD
ncbi:HTTM domain-containing protein [bacterium]|jgi:vitamin K-dependent gamma-carboxylase|nr:HTTM domain-containing protein [bacterium]